MHISRNEFREVQRLVRDLCGLVLGDDKTYLVRTRLEPVVRSHGCSHFSEYLGRVQQFDARLMRDELVEALATGETSFNRDDHPFLEFRNRILPHLAKSIRQSRGSNSPNPVARFWSAGCSTGQEPYSMAIAVHEFLAANPQFGFEPRCFPILASDVSNASLTRAVAGRFTQHEIDRGLPTGLCSRYFRRHGDWWVANDEIRRSIEFRRINLIDPLPPLGPFEIIFCRNVLIYFDIPARNRLCHQFFERLSPTGLLIIGAAENLIGLTTPFVSKQLGTTTVYGRG